MVTNIERLVEEFFKRRFPKKDIAFEKKCGYFGEWVERFESRNPEQFMDSKSLKIWLELKEDFYIDRMINKAKEVK